MTEIKAPFPWFGGKSRVAHLVWERFGDVPNYVEPFAGSLAVLLSRPTPPKIETVNDIDCYLSNFWRAVANDPKSVAKWADWPVNEADLSARHQWLVKQKEFRERMKTDPEFYDTKIAGWWVWGISCWIGSGWCRIIDDGETMTNYKRPHLGNAGKGVHRQRPHLSDAGIGIHRQLPYLRHYGEGIHQQRPNLMHHGEGIFSKSMTSLEEYFELLQARLRRVRICCGSWERVLGPTPTIKNGITGVFLDPPYSEDAQRCKDLYSHDDMQISYGVREWAIKNGNNPLLRIALCGYEGEHDMPDNWECIAWKAGGGYGSQGHRKGRENAYKERIWFSPHCLKTSLFSNIKR